MPKLIILTDSDISTKDGKLTLAISSAENNGLELQDGKLVGVVGPKGQNGSGSTQNKVGNGMGVGDSSMPTVGMNSTVSRHKKYTKNDSSFMKTNDGIVMTSPNGAMTENESVAYFMYKKKTSF